MSEPLHPAFPVATPVAVSASLVDPLVPVRVWDLPTRLFHWLLASAVVGAIVSAKVGGNAMQWHFRFGLLVLALLAFRLVWGVIGGRWSRFTSFLYAPGTVLGYLRGAPPGSGQHLDVGHNPLGSFSVFGLLGILAAQVGTGLVADDEIASVGPLNRFVSGHVAKSASSWHTEAGQWLVLTLIGLHVVAIVFYLVARKTNLVRPMVLGDKRLLPDTPASRDTLGTRLLALVVGAACAGLAVWLSRFGG